MPASPVSASKSTPLRSPPSHLDAHVVALLVQAEASTSTFAGEPCRHVQESVALGFGFAGGEPGTVTCQGRGRSQAMIHRVARGGVEPPTFRFSVGTYEQVSVGKYTVRAIYVQHHPSVTPSGEMLRAGPSRWAG